VCLQLSQKVKTTHGLEPLTSPRHPPVLLSRVRRVWPLLTCPVLALPAAAAQVEALPYVGVIAGAPTNSNSLVPMGECTSHPCL
jgi:hypothetical protein